MIAPNCPDCGATMQLRRSQKFRYPNGKPRRFWGCSEYPLCHAVIGAHPDGKPVGIPANIETRKARSRAHDAFDAWIEKYSITKNQGYRWLAEMLGVPEPEAHMGMMDKETCEAVVGLCSQGRRTGR